MVRQGVADRDDIVGKRARIVTIVLGMLVGLVAAVVLFLDSAWMRGWLEDQASEQLGRRVQIADHGIRWGLPLTLELDEVRVANPEWAETPDLARIDQLAVTLDVGRLLRGEIELERVAVQRPELLILRRDDGSTNLDDLVDDEPTQEQEVPLWPEVFVIEQGRLHFRDEGQAIALEVAFETPGESTGALSLELNGEGEVQQDEVRFQADARFDIEERRGAVEDFVGQIGDSRLEGALAFDLGGEAPRLALRLHGDSLDLDRLGLMPAADDEDDAAQPDDPEAGEWDRGLAQALAELEAIEAELDLALERLHYGGQTLHDLEAQAAVSQGRLTIERLQAYQGTQEEGAPSFWAQGWLESQDGRLAADLSARFERIDLTAALAPFGVGEIGTLDGELNLQRVEEGLVFVDTRLDYDAPQWDLSLSFRADSVERQGEPRVHLVGDGRYRQEPFAFDLHVGPLLDLTDDETPYPVAGELSAGDTHLSLDGSAVQPFALGSVEGHLTLEGPSPAQLTDLTGINLPELPPYRVSGYLSYDDDLLTLDGLEGTFGDSDVAGDVRLRLGDPPQLWATLVSQRLEADDLLPMLGVSPDTGPGETASAEQQRWEAEEESREMLFPDRPWDLAALRGTDIVLDYQALDVQAEHVPFTDLALALELAGGVMTVEPLQVGLGGGQVSASWVMDARQEALEGNLQLAIEQVNLQALLDEAGLPEVAQDTLGIIGGRGDFQYRGRSLHQVMAGLDGELELAMAQGWLDIIAAELLPLNVANALLAALTDEEQVQLECTYVQFVVERGVADLAQFFMATEIAHFTGAGAINLETERLDMAFEGHNIDPTLFTGNSPVQLQGPLREPDVNVVTPELLARGVLSVLGAIVAPPLAILPWVDPGGGEQVGMGCEQALQEYQR